MDLSKANLDYLEKDDPVKDAALTNIRAASELGVNPDSVAKSRQLASTLHMPETVVSENMDAALAKAWTQAADSWLVDAPRTSTLLADPQNAKVSHDDVEALRNIEMLRKKADETPWFSQERREAVAELARAEKDNWGITRAYNAMDYQLEKVAPLAKRQLHNVLSTGAEDEALDVELFRAKALAPEAPQPDSLFETAAYSAAELLPIILQFMGAYAAGGVAGGAGAAITVAPGFFTPATAPAAVGTTLAGAGVGAKIAGAKSAFDLESSLFFSDISDVRDENGEALDPLVKAGASVVYGAGAAGLEFVGFSALSKILPGGSKLTKEVLAPLLKEGLKDKAVQAALRDVAMRYAKGVSVETLTELGQEALSIFTEIAAKGVSEAKDGSYFAPTDWAAQAERMKDVGVKTLLGTALLGVVPAGASAVTEGRNAARVQTWRDQQVELHTAIQASQTMQRSPETMKAFGDILGLGEEVWIDAEALAQRGPELLQRIGVDPEVVAQAAQDGAPVKLNTSALMYEAEYPDLLQDLRPAPLAMSAREADSYDPVQALRDIEEAAIDAETVVAEVVAVKDRMRQTLEARGLGETLDANWELASRLSRMLSPKGDPTAFVQKLNVMADVVERQADSQVALQQDAAYAGVENEAEVEEAARLWAEMGTESPYFKRWSGGALVVRRGEDGNFQTGQPVVVETLHGSVEDSSSTSIEEFRLDETNRGAFFGARDADAAYSYVRAQGGVYPLYFKFENPLVVDADGMDWQSIDYNGDMVSTDDLVEEAKRLGHDGLVVVNVVDSGGGPSGGGTTDVVAVFSPTQIKSATGNRGTFDPADARILNQSLSPEAQAMADRIAQALQQTEEGPAVGAEVALPPTTLYQVQNLPEWRQNVTAWMQKNGYTDKEIKRHLGAMEGQMKIFSALGPYQMELLPQGVRENRGRRAKGTGGPFRDNSDPIYKITFDASAMCVRRLEAAATAAYIQSRIGRALTTSERMALVSLFRMAGKTAPCLYCYVEAPRAKMATFAQKGIDIALGKAIPKNWSKAMQEMAARAQEEVAAVGLTADEINANQFIDPDYIAANADAIEALGQKAPATAVFVRAAALAAKANLPKRYEEYISQVLDIPQSIIDELNTYAGLRFFSSSDFQAEHVADLMQAFFDMELRKIRAHSYTKVPMFVEIFGDTGMKIQTSIFARETPDGRFVQDTLQGMDWGQAKAFRQKHGNVGTILVATSDNILNWALTQDWIDYVIPFHFSGMEVKHYAALSWQDFTSTQTEVWVNPASDRNWENAVNPEDRGETNDKGKPVKPKPKKIRMHDVGVAKGISDEQATKKYLELAMKRGLVPVFPTFLFKDSMEPVLNKKGQPVNDQRKARHKRAVARWEMMVKSGQIDWEAINPNYFKLKKDYARTDTPFNPVKAKFNLGAAQSALDSFLLGNEPKAQVDEEIANRLVDLINGAEGSGRDIGIEMLRAARAQEDQQSMTLNQAAYHGSPYKFSKFSLEHMGSGEGAQAYGWGLYFAGKKEVAEFYRQALTKDQLLTVRMNGKIVAQGENIPAKGLEAVKYLEAGARRAGQFKHNTAYYAKQMTQDLEVLDLIEAWKDAKIGYEKNPGQLYKVEIPEDDVLLLWDRPLSEQPEKVREALGTASDLPKIRAFLGGMRGQNFLDNAQYFRGHDLYEEISASMGGDKAASEYLNSLGIKGIKFLDGASRSAGEGSYNYVIFDDSTIDILETFYQQQNSGPRGAYNQLKDGSHLVRLFEQANASTMPHELAHAFLTELRAMAETGVADEAMLNDMQKIEAWLDREAVEGSPEWQSYYEDGLALGLDDAKARSRATFVLRHEKFSRGFEQYLWEGKAPEPELEGVFARFSRWLKEIYKTAMEFGVNLDPEIRSVFDRMLKADAEVESKVMELGFTPMTQALAKHLGLGPEDRDYAVRLYSAALEKAEAKLAQARNKGLRKLRAEWKKDAIEEAKNSPVHQMLYTLRKGRGIDKAEFLALYGDEAAKGLPRGVLREGGLSLNEAAFEHNYDTHEQMVNDLWNYRKPEDIAAEVVEARTAERDATFKVEDYILETAEFAAYQELMAKAYDRGGNVLSNKAFRDYARKIVATMPLADAMDVRGFLAAMARHHKAETKALKAGKLADAAKANKKARLNHAYAQEALNVRKRVEKAERMAKRLTKLKAGQIEEGHHKALLQLIQRFGLTKKDYSGLQDVSALADLVKLQDAFGADEEASFSQWLLSGEARNYKDLTSGEFEELQDLMKFLYGTGKDMIRPTLKVSGLDMQDVRDQIVPQIEALPKRGKRRKEGTWLRKMQDQVQSYLSQNRTILWIIRELDGYTALKGVVGPLEKWLYEPLEAANLKRAELSRQLEKRTRKARAQLLKSATAKANKVSLVDLPVPPAWQRQGRVWDFDACLSVLMNMGNAVNRQRVMDGYNLTEQDLQKILAVFSQEDAHAVQDIWDAMDEILWPEIAGTHKKLRFYTPGKVQAEAFTMPDGTVLRGGYYPLKYDPSADTRAARNQDLDKAVQNPATAMLPKSVASGATKARAASAGGMPVLLRTSVLSGHLDWAVHYASHALVIHDLGRILGDKEIAEAIKTAAGEETFRAANELVKRIANPRAGDLPTFLDKVFGKLTGISAVYSMWMNRFGPLTQPTAIGNYIAAEGGWGKGTATWMKGAAHFMANPAKQWNWLMENNAALKNHFTLIRQQLSNAIGEDFRDIQLGKTKSGRVWTATKETVIRGGIAMYGVMDAVVSVPGWYGSYLRGLDERLSPDDAMVRANKIMAEYTPMSREMDKTLFQHTKGMARAWTYMMSYFTKMANTNAGFWKAWRQGAIGTDQFIGQIVAVQILPAVVVSMMYSLLTGDDDDRDNILLDAGLEVAAYPFAGLPFAREGAAWAANLARAGLTGDTKKLGRNAFQMPGMMYLQLMQRAGSTTYAMVQDFDDDEKQAKALMSLAELTAASAGLPPVPKIAKEVIRGLDDIDDDEGNILNVLIKPKIRKRD